MKTPQEYSANGTEFAHQAALFMWCGVAAKFGIAAASDGASYSEKGHAAKLLMFAQDTVPELEWLYAVKNAVGRNNAVAGARNVAEGVKSGVPDLCLPIPRPGIGVMATAGGPMAVPAILHALYIEMKRPGSEGKRKGITSDPQDKWQTFLRNNGYAVEVCFGWEAARDAILKYLGR